MLGRVLQKEGPGRPLVADSLGTGAEMLMDYARVLCALSFAVFTKLHLRFSDFLEYVSIGDQDEKQKETCPGSALFGVGGQ